MKATGLKKITRGTNYSVIVLLVAGILTIINAFSYRHFFRVDLTENKRFTISDSSKRILAELDDIVNIKVYLSKKLPPYMTNITDQVRDLLEEYSVYAQGNLSVDYIDPADDPATQQKLRFMGIPQLRLNIVEKDQAAITTVYMGLAVLYGDNKEVIPALTDLSTLEYDITSKILRVTNDEVQNIGFLSGHGEPDLQKEFGTINNELREQYFTRPVDINGGKKIPPDISALVIASPQELTERELFEIDQYLMAGGNILFLIDRVTIQERGLRGMPAESNITKLLEHYGVRVLPELVLDQLNANASFQSGMFSLFVPYPFWVRVVRQNIPDDHPIINGLESIVLPWASPLEVLQDKTKALDVAILAQSSEYSWVQKGFFDLNPRQDFVPQPDQVKPRIMAVALSGTFSSFFAGKTVPPVEQPKDENDSKQPPPPVQETDEDRIVIQQSPETKIIVVGNSRFITSSFPEQFNGNRTFFLNAVDWFTFGDYLINIRSREAGERPLSILSEKQKAFVRYGNMFGIPALLVVFGLIQLSIRKRRKRRGITV